MRTWILWFVTSFGALTHPVWAEQLGTVKFPTSAAAAAQPAFERGVALLHSFQYDEAQRAFDEALRRDSRCAICHWGKAMVLYHQLWDWPSSKTLAKGRQEIAWARALSAKTSRERGYVAAAAAFFEPRGGISRASRVRAYSQALATLHRRFPQDGEATAFYALSLIGLTVEGVDVLPNLRRAIALLEPLFRQQPNHPGAAHYLIHAADRPELAPKGLAAARAYAAIAPDSSHALHMPSHIFTQLGLWQESIATNLRAAASGAQAAMGHHGDASYQLHAMDYLANGYLQTGQEAKAQHVLVDLNDVPAADEAMKAYHRRLFSARHVLDLHRWKDAASLETPPTPSRFDVETYHARAIGSARSGDIAAARRAIALLRTCLAEREAKLEDAEISDPSVAPIELQEADSWLAFAEGRAADAINKMRHAADREDAQGGESMKVPAREMLGDLLLALNRPSEALEAYRSSLQKAPNRFNSLLGAGQAARIAGHAVEAQTYHLQLLNIVASDGDRPEIRQVRILVGRK